MPRLVVMTMDRRIRSANLSPYPNHRFFNTVFPPSLRDGRQHVGKGRFYADFDKPILRRRGSKPRKIWVRLTPAERGPYFDDRFLVEWDDGDGAMSSPRNNQPIEYYLVPAFVIMRCGIHLSMLKWKTYEPIRDRKTTIYFLKPQGQDIVKIGRTNNLRRRIERLQTGSAERLSLLAAYEDVGSEEAYLHALFGRFRIRHDGEWFTLSDEIKQFIVSKGFIIE